MLRLGEQETTMAGFDYTLVQKWFGRARFQLLDLMRGTQSLTLLKELEAVQFESQEVIRFRQKKCWKHTSIR
jgi:phenylacetate-CoA ligase